jgi:hypothetical protein
MPAKISIFARFFRVSSIQKHNYINDKDNITRPVGS